MYNEFRGGTKRGGWVYPYKGEALAEAARRRLAFHCRMEEEARHAASEMYKDHRISSQDPRISKANAAAQSHGNLREQCEVYAHEFARTPDREFLLDLGDVVFFGLAGHEPVPDGD